MRKHHSKPEKPVTESETDDVEISELIASLSANIAEWEQRTMGFAEERQLQDAPVKRFSLRLDDRAILAALPKLPPAIRTKLLKPAAEFTLAEVASLGTPISKALLNADLKQQVALLRISQTLMDSAKAKIAQFEKPTRGKRTKSRADTKTLYQFKITLKDSKPPIWRRIQVKDGTLDKLHEHIQTAMGWMNSHLHQFTINGQSYGDPELLDDGFNDNECIDSTRTKISQIVPASGKPFKFLYEYDFGDSWLHEIFFEGCPPPEKRKKYPLCVEGARACPPEDVGGIGAYYGFLEALADPTHEDHEQFLEWSGPFDPMDFDVAEATSDMRDGLPDWRR